MKVSALGPEGTYSSHAAQLLAPQAELALAVSNPEAIRMVSVGESQRGVVPIENSIGGIVTASLDGLFEHNLTVVDEAVLDIHHALVGIEAPERPDDVERILSHPQGLAQCARYLAVHYPHAELVDMNSTAEGMAVVAETQDRKALAIGPDPAADVYGLVKIDQAIEDETGNQTRFVAFSSETKGGKELGYIMMCVIPDTSRVGLLHDITGVFVEQGVGMLDLHSRPMRKKLGLHKFYTRLEMNSDDARYESVAATIEALGTQVVRMSA